MKIREEHGCSWKGKNSMNESFPIKYLGKKYRKIYDDINIMCVCMWVCEFKNGVGVYFIIKGGMRDSFVNIHLNILEWLGIEMKSSYEHDKSFKTES